MDDPYRPAFVEVDLAKCDAKGHKAKCTKRFECWWDAWDEYINGNRQYADIPPMY